MVGAQVKAAAFALGGVCLVAYLALLACDTNIAIRQDDDRLKRPWRQGLADWLDLGYIYYDVIFTHSDSSILLKAKCFLRAALASAW